MHKKSQKCYPFKKLDVHTMSADVCTDPEDVRRGRPGMYMCRHKLMPNDIGRGYPPRTSTDIERHRIPISLMGTFLRSQDIREGHFNIYCCINLPVTYPNS
jgi:hypothetical protein